MTTPQDPSAFERLVREHWPAAREHWSRFLLLSDPVDDSEQSSVAQIHLGNRQVSLNYQLLGERGLEDCIEALLAHEIGHHVRYPATLGVHARMRLLEKSLIPLEDYTLTNLFTDLMINQYLGERGLREALVKVYRAFDPGAGWKRDPAFLFYLTLYEELWQLPDGHLMGSGREAFEAEYPHYRGEAHLVSQKLFHLEPNIYTQFLYFDSVLCRYVKPPEIEEPENTAPYSCHADEPDPEDWAEALRRSSREDEALRRALEEGWLTREDLERLRGEGSLERRIAGLPGMATLEASRVPEIMAAFYRREAERFLVRPPPRRLVGEAVVPTTLEDWQPGDSVGDIDWLQTLLREGEELAAARPIRRVKIAEEEGYEVPLWQPRIEIYLDTSGSMPDPRLSLNAMTLAAVILVAGALRGGGWARALIYSTDVVCYWQWCRSEVELSRFLMHYFGAGTIFPFATLASSLEECGDRQPIRVIISDNDFDNNYDGMQGAAHLLSDAAARSRLLLLQHIYAPERERVRYYTNLGLSVIPIYDFEDYPKVAAQLTQALFHDALPVE